MIILNELSIKRALNDSTRKQGVLVNGEVYSLHITKNREAIITDNRDYSKIYAIHSLDFYNASVREDRGMGESGVTIVCREVDKNTGKIAAYVCKKDVEDRDLFLCSIRARCNPELRYYAIRTCVANDEEYLEEVLSLLKRRNLTDEAIKRYGGIVRL